MGAVPPRGRKIRIPWYRYPIPKSGSIVSRRSATSVAATATGATAMPTSAESPVCACSQRHVSGQDRGPALTDIHARLYPSRPALQRRAEALTDVLAVVAQARRRGLSIAVSGGRHAMGGQQFLQQGCVLDMRGMNRILAFDRERGRITVEAGITWPELMRGYLARQAGSAPQWGIRQKQTGADALTIGGALAANIHGRGLACPPFSAD